MHARIRRAKRDETEQNHLHFEKPSNWAHHFSPNMFTNESFTLLFHDFFVPYRLITSAVDLKLNFFAESCEEGATSDHNIKKQLKGHIEGVFLSKTKDTLTLATSFENTNQLKT